MREVKKQKAVTQSRKDKHLKWLMLVLLLSLLSASIALLLAPDRLFAVQAAPLLSVSDQLQVATATSGPCSPNCATSVPSSIGSAASVTVRPDSGITPSLAKAPDSGLKMSVEAGIGRESYVRGGTWLPVYISLENNGGNISGEVVINIAPDQNNQGNRQRAIQQYTSLYVQHVELARGSRKQLTMYVPYPQNDLFNRSVTVELNGVQEGQNQPHNLALATADLKPMLNQLLVGYIATNPDAFRPYDDMVLGNAQNSNTYGKAAPIKHLLVTALDPARLPTISQALGSLNVLVLQDFDPTSFSLGQWSAIESWVRQGGVLLLSGGTGATRILKNFPATLAPAAPPASGDIGEIDAASLNALEKSTGNPLPSGIAGGKTYIARLKPAEDASVLLKGDIGLPLAFEVKRGAGAVVMTAFDLAEPRFANWGGNPELWETLIGRYQNALQQFGPYSAYGINSSNLLNGGLTNVLTNIPGVGIPSLKIIAVLVLIYIAIVGPGNYFVLRALRKLELSWITLPVLTVLFAGGIYLFALKDKGGDLLTTSVSVVRLSENDSQSIGPLEKAAISLTGIFTPNDSSYVLNLPRNSLTSAIPNYTSFQPAGPGVNPGQPAQTQPTPLALPALPVGLRIVQGEQPQVDLLGMSQWSFRSVIVEGSVKLAGGLSGRFVQNDNKLTGSLSNNTGRPLTDVTVVTAFGAARLGDLAPGQVVPVEFDNAYGTPSSGVYGLYPGSQTVSYRSGPPQFSGSPADRLQSRKYELLNSLAGSLPVYSGGYNPSYQVQNNSSSIVALAWSDKPLLDYAVNGRTIGGNDLALFVADLTIDLDQSSQILPGILTGKVSDKVALPVANSAGTVSGGNYLPAPPSSGSGTSLEAGSITVDFELPQLLKALQTRKLNKLIFEAPAFSFNRSGYGPQQAPKYSAEIYNYRTVRWEAVPVMLAPSPCLSQVPAYSGGQVSAPISGLSQPGSGASQACLNTFGRSGPVPTPTVAGKNSSATPGPTGATTSAKTPTSTPVPTLPAYYPGSAPDGFIVLQNGPDFDLTQYIGPDGKIRLRFSRDAKNSDVVYWNYFSVGYELTSK